METRLPREGWYPDPAGGTRLRWWDGTDWTDHYRTRPLDRGALVSEDQARLIERRARDAVAEEVRENPLEHTPELRNGAPSRPANVAANQGAPRQTVPTRTPPPPGAVRMTQPGQLQPNPALRMQPQPNQQAAPGQTYPGRPAPGPNQALPGAVPGYRPQAVPPTPAPPQRPAQPAFGRAQSYQKPLQPSSMQVGGHTPGSSLRISRGFVRFIVVLGIVLLIRLMS